MATIINDVSAYQGVIDWRSHLTKRPLGAIIRVHSGRTGLDPMFRVNRAQAHACGAVALGLYQIIAPERDAAQQARELVSLVGTLAGNEWVMLDIEPYRGDEQPDYSRRVRSWLAVVEPGLGCRAWVYADLSHWHDAIGLAAVGARPRMVAAYRSTLPDVPFALWQHTDQATAPGVVGKVDESLFLGTQAQFLALVLRSGC